MPRGLLAATIGGGLVPILAGASIDFWPAVDGRAARPPAPPRVPDTDETFAAPADNGDLYNQTEA